MEAGPVRRGPGSHLRPGNERGEIRHCGGLALQRPQARLGGDACGRRRVILRVCVYGAEAIGGFIGLRLAMAGHEVSVVARGATLEAIQKYGLRARTSEGLLNADVAASEDPGALGPQDLVIIAVKTPSLAQIAGKIGPLLGQETVIVTAMNGIPWWFFHGFGGSCEDKSLDTVDPDGVIAAGISSARVIGGVVRGRGCRQARGDWCSGSRSQGDRTDDGRAHPIHRYSVGSLPFARPRARTVSGRTSGSVLGSSQGVVTHPAAYIQKIRVPSQSQPSEQFLGVNQIKAALPCRRWFRLTSHTHSRRCCTLCTSCSAVPLSSRRGLRNITGLPHVYGPDGERDLYAFLAVAAVQTLHKLVLEVVAGEKL